MFEPAPRNFPPDTDFDQLYRGIARDLISAGYRYPALMTARQIEDCIQLTLNKGHADTNSVMAALITDGLRHGLGYTTEHGYPDIVVTVEGYN